MEKIELKIKNSTVSGYTKIRKQLDEFVKENFDTLFHGAGRLGAAIGADYYAPRRVQLHDTRLHEGEGLKIMAGHHYRHDWQEPTEAECRQGVTDIQQLLDAAAEKISATFELRIVEK